MGGSLLRVSIFDQHKSWDLVSIAEDAANECSKGGLGSRRAGGTATTAAAMKLLAEQIGGQTHTYVDVLYKVVSA